MMNHADAKTASSVRAVIYLRISLDAEMDGLAIERQREDCEKLAAFRGWEVVKTYVDQSISASDANKVRPQYNQMVQDYELGFFDALICWDLDRLTRQPRQLEDWIDRAVSRGLLLVTANGDADLSQDGGRMYARIKAAVARAEVERKGARQQRAQRQRAEMGRPPKGVRPIGYALDGSIIEDEGKAVTAIFEAFHKGFTLSSIARALSGNDVDGTGVPKTMRHTRRLALERNAKRRAEGKPERPVPEDGPWTGATVMELLRNPRYAGYSVYTPKQVRKMEAGESRRKALKNNIVRDEAGEPVRGQWKPLVDEDVWWAVQRTLDDPARVTNRTGSTTRKHLGAGLYRCAECGEPVITRSIYYSCKKGHLNRTRTHVDEFVRTLIAARLSRKDAKRRVRGVESYSEDSFSEEITRERGRIERAQRDYDAEIIEGADLKRIRDDARAKIESLEARRMAAHGRSVLLPILGARNPATAFLEANNGIQRQVIDALVIISLKPGVRGQRGFNPESVDVQWR